MELTKFETEAVSEVEAKISERKVTQLSEFQLALAAGGCGEVLFG